MGSGEFFTRRVLDSLVAFVGVVDLDGTLIQVNRAPLEVVGLRLVDVVGQKLWDSPWFAHSAEVRDWVREACARAARGVLVRGDVTIRTATEGRIIIDLQIAPLYDDAGKITHLVPSGVDVTERREIEAALRRSEELVRTVAETSTQGLAMMDADGVCSFANRAWLKMTGYTMEEMRQKPLHELVHHHRRDGAALARSECPIDRALPENFAVRAHEDVFFRKDGSSFPVVCAANPIVRDGRPFATVVEIRDLSESKRFDAELREREERFRALADNISQLVWMTDERGSLTWYNRRWFEFTGTTLDEMKGWGWKKVHHPDHVARVVGKYQRHLESGEPWEDTFPLRGRDGEYRWFLSRAQPIRDAEGRIVRWFGTNTDITAQREAEETLRQAIHLRDEFLSVASHELRTPVTALALYLEGLKRIVDPAGIPRASEKIAGAIAQSARLGALVESLLDVSRIALGRLRLHIEHVDLRELVAETVHRLGDIAARAHCDVRITPGAAIVGEWDRARLEQVVVNILGNAIRYGPGCPIDIELRTADGAAELTIRDRGIGISPADQRRIFGRFERAVSDRHYGGLGLGLYIARQIVEAHGGEISVSSAPGEGAAFTVRLPL